MTTIDVLFVRVYITESSKLRDTIVQYLNNEAKMRGITVFRAIGGYGDSGQHSSSLLDISLDLPLVIEFFDSIDKTKLAIEHLMTIIKSEHIVFWEAKVNA